MRLLLCLVLFVQFMDFKEFEKLIGKDISYANLILLDEGFKYHKPLEIPFYTSDSYQWFYGMPYNMISIITDDKDMVKSVTIHLHKVIDSRFYDLFILDYGNPDTTQVVEGYDSVGKWTGNELEEEIELKARKVTFKMKEGTFEENPLFMIWNKKAYQVRALSKHEQNISEITFRVPIDKL